MITWILAAVGGVVAVWLLLNVRRSRPDGTPLDVHPYRQLMPYVMPGRNESIVFFDTEVDARALLAYLEEARGRFEVNITHCLVAAVAVGLAENPSMNRFVSGRRLYQRKGRFVTFSMKRKRLDESAKLAVVKLEMNSKETFRQLCERINDSIGVERSDKKTHADKEYALFTLIPRPLLLGAVSLFRWLDHYGLLPGFFIETDGMYTSVFVANLGSVGMAPGYHHLYEWGNCPLFMMVGKVEERPVVVDGQVVVRPTLPIRFSYDERIDDGLTARSGIDTTRYVLEHPLELLGCLKDDASDALPLAGRPARGSSR